MAIENTIAGICAQILRVILTFTRPYSDYVLDFLYQLFMGKTKPLPPIEEKLLLIPAVQLAEKIRKRQLRCEDLMRAYVERSRVIHPFINAAVDARYEEALEDAREVDRFLEGEHKSEEEIARETPLLGIPFTCKEAIGVKDLIQTCGLVWAKEHKAKQDSDSAALYRKAGAIPVTVTNVPETCLWWESSNLVHGMTKNPYNNARTVGGSSGGESALITSGGALIGIGNDLAGSIRIPASFCGIYGHKPTSGVVSNYGSFPYCEMDVKNEKIDAIVSTGPMCRYVEDIPLLMKVLTDNDKRVKLDEKVDFHKVKIYYIEEIPGKLHKSVPAVKEAVKEAANYFREQYGVEPIPLTIEELEYGFYIWESKLLETGIPPMKGLLELKTGNINLWYEFFKSIFRCADHTWPAIYNAMVDRREKDQFYYDCLEKHKALCQKFDQIFSEDAVLFMPTHPEPPPHYLTTIPKYPNIGYTCIFSIQGFPSTQIPAGLCNELPIGLQAISGKFKDHLTIAAALELDKVFGGWKCPCTINV